MWIIPPTKGTALVAILSLTMLTTAVSLSDFSPLIDDLPAACNDAYYTTIPGCTVSDFKSSQHTCSKGCLAGLVQINALVSTACATADVEETSIIGLFKLGKAIQLLCNVDVVTTTTGLGGGVGGSPTTVSMTASIGQSTMVLSSATPVTSGVLTDTNVPGKPTSTLLTSVRQSTTPLTTSNTPTSTNGILVDTSTVTSKTSTAQGGAQTQKLGGNVGSGGGSPFDNINNSSATSIRSVNNIIGSALVALLFGAYVILG